MYSWKQIEIEKKLNSGSSKVVYYSEILYSTCFGYFDLWEYFFRVPIFSSINLYSALELKKAYHFAVSKFNKLFEIITNKENLLDVYCSLESFWEMTILSKSHIETNYCCEIFTNFTMKKVEIDGAFHLAEFYLSLPGTSVAIEKFFLN